VQRVYSQQLLLLVVLLQKKKQKSEHYFMKKKITAGDKIRLGVIGFGIQGHFDLQTALKVPGVELAGICDLYTGRIQNAKEMYGNDLFTTRNYHDLLEKSDMMR
jgi:predicted homoserine dehydrogenase-like protein